MIPLLDLAQACADSYQPPQGFFLVREIDGIYVALRNVSGGTIVCFRGSVTAEDWHRDFEGLPKKHPVLGMAHEGFLEGMDDAGAWIVGNLPADLPYAITGHSLGAARALILAGLLTASGRSPESVLALGCPRPGFRQLSDIILSGGYPVMCVRNGPDPVAEVPIVLPDFPYCKPVPDTHINEPPENPIDPFNWHHCPLYLQGVKKMA